MGKRSWTPRFRQGVFPITYISHPIRTAKPAIDADAQHSTSNHLYSDRNPLTRDPARHYLPGQRDGAVQHRSRRGGRVVHTQQYLANVGENVYQRELETLSGGVYLVQVQAADQRAVEKLIVLER